ncbi:multicopper oxidase domain-containing protein [Aliiroseovarius crassostreae]|uniref:multicopper oxidase domain-containing protein n=1 Tax=Aliiroseovarius crassostreae TaxID=154981 RepID=UPI002882FB2A|nr:multicopper oxidase domain-containing protein [Aliiroseovarius crassostreae]
MIRRRGLLTGFGAGAVASFVPNFLRQTMGQSASENWGFNQPNLGPTVRLGNKGDVQAEIENRLKEAISVHWHGMIILPFKVDTTIRARIAAIPDGLGGRVQPWNQPMPPGAR